MTSPVYITVPNMNDSVSRIVLNGEQYGIRFTYNDTHDYWSFGLYDGLGNPLAIGIKIVPGIVLNMFFGVREMPKGVFYTRTKLDRIGKDAFQCGDAHFAWLSLAELKESHG